MKNPNTLIVTIEGGGNVPPMLGLAKKLMGSGHSITILSEPCLEETAIGIGASFVTFKEHFLREERKDDLFQDWNASKINSPVLERVMFGPASSVIKRSIEIIQSHSIDLLVIDVLLFPALIAAEYMKIPKVVVFHMPEYLPGRNRPPGNMGLKPGNSFFFRMRDKILGKLMTLKFDEYKPSLNNLLASLSLPSLKHTIDLFERADLRLIQTLKSFDVPIEPAPKNVRYTGPELDDPDWTLSGKWESPWPDQDKKPLVVISFSSTFQNQAKAIQNCIDALSGLPVNGCVTLGLAMEDMEFLTPDNVVVMKSVKHSLLFPHADLVITHGGHGTMMKSLVNGLPIICLPMGRDQADNAVKIELNGCGIKLSPKSRPHQIKKAIQRVLSDEKYKRNAEKMRKEILSNNGMDSTLKEISDLISNNKQLDHKKEGVK